MSKNLAPIAVGDQVVIETIGYSRLRHVYVGKVARVGKAFAFVAVVNDDGKETATEYKIRIDEFDADKGAFALGTSMGYTVRVYPWDSTNGRTVLRDGLDVAFRRRHLDKIADIASKVDARDADASKVAIDELETLVASLRAGRKG